MTFAVNLTESGRLAFEAGIKAKDCPLKIGSAARTLWLKGWRKARDAKLNENRLIDEIDGQGWRVG